MNWVSLSLQWYLIIFFLGIISLPLTSRIFNHFPDKGYAFSKIISILFISYAVFVLGIFRILPFTRGTLLVIGLVLAIVNVFIALQKKQKEKRNISALMVFEEILFFVSFIVWVYVRGQEPSLRSLEKFMDFGFMNSILRAKYFPPLDMWLSGNHPINYYYFGHLTGAMLIRLTGIKSAIGYNLILSTLLGLGMTGAFSLTLGIIRKKLNFLKTILFGLVGSIIVNLGGNLHTIYLFTKGYPNDHPIPFWQIFSWFNPSSYWYPNATRFIPYTIHEFPSYSYVVADLHGHVFDIPFVLMTIAILYSLFTKTFKKNVVAVIFLGFMTAVHYMTNAFDGPIYLLLTTLVLLKLFKLTSRWLFHTVLLFLSFIAFSVPFSMHFTPFVTGIGVNCSPRFLVDIGRFGPFLFEKGNCQISPPWMLFVLWGFFWINFIILSLVRKRRDHFPLLLFSFGTFLIIVPEFFYIKDIYPLHFRANTMFKLGYQAFIMMGIASAYTFYRIKTLKRSFVSVIATAVFIISFGFITVYYFFAVPSYYGNLNRSTELDGSVWLRSFFPEDKEIVDYLNTNVKGQPIILEAQGDSYTDYERISANTGLPTVAGWWVHEWLWRGSANVVSDRIPDIIAIYESSNLLKTRTLIHKYGIRYVIVSGMEKQKYPNLKEDKFNRIGHLILRTSNGVGALYEVN